MATVFEFSNGLEFDMYLDIFLVDKGELIPESILEDKGYSIIYQSLN